MSEKLTSKFQKYLIETFKNYNPDLLFFGHTNNIDLETLASIKNQNKTYKNQNNQIKKQLIIKSFNSPKTLVNFPINIPCIIATNKAVKVKA